MSSRDRNAAPEAPGGRPVDLVRLEPAQIASIFPLQKEDRTLVAIADAPPLLVTGLQAIEDRNFKHHPGIDLRAIARAMLANLKALALKGVESRGMVLVCEKRNKLELLDAIERAAILADADAG